MPPESEGTPLSTEDVAQLKAWIDQGAKSPADEQPQPDPRRHWSFQPLEVPGGSRGCRVSATARTGSGTRSTHSWPRNIANTD